MSDFSLPTIFVVAGTNTLPTTGSTDVLTAGQFGMFDQNYAALTAATAPAAKYVYLAQGRKENIPALGSKRSDRIYGTTLDGDKIINWYKIPSVSAVQNQITNVSDINALCEEYLVLTLRLFSNWIETAYFNGLTRSFTIQAPCCDCGADPCTVVDAETIVDQFVAAINADVLVSKYVVASKTGTGAAAVLVITGKALDKYGNPCSPTAFTYEYDKLRFDVFAYKNPETTQDYIVANACDVFATVTKVQDSTYPRGAGDDIYELEKNYFSYQTTHKSLFRNVEYDGAFERYSVSTAYYSMYFLKFKDPDNYHWELAQTYDQEIIVAVEAGSAAETALDALFTARFGAPTIITTV